jgi:hypothetical protein
MSGDLRALLLIVLGAVWLALGGTTLWRAARSGRLRLRGGGIVTRARNPVFFYASLAALGVAVVLSLFLILKGATLLGRYWP